MPVLSRTGGDEVQEFLAAVSEMPDSAMLLFLEHG